MNDTTPTFRKATQEDIERPPRPTGRTGELWNALAKALEEGPQVISGKPSTVNNVRSVMKTRGLHVTCRRISDTEFLVSLRDE